MLLTTKKRAGRLNYLWVYKTGVDRTAATGFYPVDADDDALHRLANYFYPDFFSAFFTKKFVYRR